MAKEVLALGADPEFFLYDTVKQSVVSAHDLVPGDKKTPHKLKDGAVQVDGVAVEFNINPAFSAEEFEHNMNSVMEEVRGMIDKRFEFQIEPIVYFQSDYFSQLPDFVKELGCAPDLSAHSGNQKRVPVIEPANGRVLRTAAGHLHLGWTTGKDVAYDKSHAMDCYAIARLFNTSTTHVFSAMETKPGDNAIRKRFYGGDGAYRIKPYGVELRSPSNTWISRPKLYKSIYKILDDMMQQAMSTTNKTDLSFYKSRCFDVNHLVKNAKVYNRNNGDKAYYKQTMSKIGFDNTGMMEFLTNG